MTTYTCNKCTKTFNTPNALQGHQRVHSPKYEIGQAKHADRLRAKNKQKSKSLEIQYYKDPRHCPECDTILPYNRDVKRQTFCNSSCAASFNNRARRSKSKETKEKIQKSVLLYHANNPKPPKPKLAPKLQRNNSNKTKCIPSGDFSKLYHCTCSHCGFIGAYRIARKYCNNHASLYKSNNRNRYTFTFSIGSHPLLFTQYSSRLKAVGMWSRTNTNGLTRDHRVSVNEAILNDYDPYYIKHPVNCELMSWTDNNKKKTKSSITFPDLQQLVDAYDSALLVVLRTIQPPLA